MDIHRYVAGNIGAINPFVLGTVKISTGSTSSPSAKRTPTYDEFDNVSMQIQELSQPDLARTDGLNQQGVHRAIYLSGHVSGLVRVKGRGGDLIITPDGQTWLVTAVLERWPDWCKVHVTLQDGS